MGVDDRLCLLAPVPLHWHLFMSSMSLDISIDHRSCSSHEGLCDDTFDSVQIRLCYRNPLGGREQRMGATLIVGRLVQA